MNCDDIKNLSLSENVNEDFVDPWNVTSSSDTGVDYSKLIGNFIIHLPHKKLIF